MPATPIPSLCRLQLTASSPVCIMTSSWAPTFGHRGPNRDCPKWKRINSALKAATAQAEAHRRLVKLARSRLGSDRPSHTLRSFSVDWRFLLTTGDHGEEGRAE